MISDSIIARCVAIRSAYRELERQHHGEEWSISEDLLALSNDIGNFDRLAMTRLGRYYDETPYTLEEKLVENIWWLIELGDRLNIDVQGEMEEFLSKKEKLLGISSTPSQEES